MKALEASPKKIQYMTDAFRKQLDLVMELIREIEDFQTNVPDGAFCIFPDVSRCFDKRYGDQYTANASDPSLYLLESRGSHRQW